MGLGPFDLTGGPFLTLYIALLIATIIAGFIIPKWLRPDGRSLEVTDPDELAYLSGGKNRFVETVVARLLAARALFIMGKGKLERDPRHRGGTAAERSVLALEGPVGWGKVERAIAPHAEPIRERLIADELLMRGGDAWQLRFWSTVPYLMLLGFGAIKWEVGVLRDRPVGFLTALMILTGIFALIRFASIDRRTDGGKAALAEARRRSERLRRAPTGEETALAVALFGTVVLAGSAWSEFHRMRSDSGSSSSGDSSSSSDGGGGCGGGGCGGCGG